MCPRRTYRNSSINKSSMQQRGTRRRMAPAHLLTFSPSKLFMMMNILLPYLYAHFPFRGYFQTASSYACIFAILENQEKLGNRPCIWCVIWSPFFIAVRRREAWIHVVLSSAVPRLKVMCHKAFYTLLMPNLGSFPAIHCLWCILSTAAVCYAIAHCSFSLFIMHPDTYAKMQEQWRKIWYPCTLLEGS